MIKLLATLGLLFLLTSPAYASHIPLLRGETYTDKIIVCKKDKLMAYIEDYKRIVDSEQETLEWHECYVQVKTFIVDDYVCGFDFFNGYGAHYSVIKIVDPAYDYVIFHMSPHIARRIECTAERINSYPIRIPNIWKENQNE